MAGLAAVLQARSGGDAGSEGRELAQRAHAAARAVGSRAVLRWTPWPGEAETRRPGEAETVRVAPWLPAG
jgi:hypothetical protein